MRSHFPTRSNTPAPNELEYLDVFDLFNFPRASTMPENFDGQGFDPGVSSNIPGMNHNGGLMMPNFVVPNPETDWLFNPGT